MKRAKLRGLKRDAAAVLGNVGTREDVPLLRQALDDEELLVLQHAAWAIAHLRVRAEVPPDVSAVPPASAPARGSSSAPR
jgi:HEAT repeat protein